MATIENDKQGQSYACVTRAHARIAQLRGAMWDAGNANRAAELREVAACKRFIREAKAAEAAR